MLTLSSDQFTDWTNRTIEQLFNHADSLGFKLFFSFDMNSGYFSDPAQFRGYLELYIKRPSYYYYNGHIRLVQSEICCANS